jgi:hypothetical protein
MMATSRKRTALKDGATNFISPLKGAVALILLCLFCNHSPAAPRDLYHRQARIWGTGLDEPRQLPDSLLIEGSEQITLYDSLLVRDRDYRIDYLRGIIRFTRTLSLSDTAQAQYQVFPFRLRTSYFHSLRTVLPGQLAADSSKKTTPLTDPSAFDTGTLRKSGTLVRGITIGSDRDLTVQSGLNLQVEGRLGRNVDVLALLSDQNTPLQPEGNTATLQEIDKVLVQVQSEHYGATLGDYDLQFEGPRFGSYSRKLQGGMLEGRTKDNRLRISGAVSKGQYQTNSFLGQEGNQGPYRLADREGRASILVLAGTEQVWVDGVVQQRGENNDYTIEYGLGEITFTPRRLITSDSRITVDFQYSQEAYGRDIYALQGQGRFIGFLNLRTTLISESDTRNDPLSFVLTDSSRAALQNAGDDPNLAQIYSVDSVAVGQGTYVLDSLSFGGQIYPAFVWVGPDTIGYLNVAFSYVGLSMGDYQRQASAGGFYYQWVGPDQGDYDPIQRLPLPQTHRLADVELWAEPSPNTSVKFEGALSQLDRNTFSSLGDGDNVGQAWSVAGRWSGLERQTGTDTEKFSRVALDANIRRVDDNFRQIDRTQAVEYARQWNLPGTSSEGESVQEAALTIRPISPLTSKLGYGLLEKSAEGFRSERWSGETSLLGWNLPALRAQADWVRTSSDLSGVKGFWTRGQASVSHTLWRLSPSLHYEREHKRDDLADSLGGFQFNLYNAGLGYQAGPLTVSATQEIRDDQRYRENTLQAFSRAWTQGYKANLVAWHSLTGSAGYTHRVKSYSNADSAKTMTDLAETNIGWTPLGRFVDLLAHYRLNNTRASSLVQIPVYVGPGQGTHVKVGELYYEDPDGDYILVLQSTGQFTPVIDLEGSLSLDLDPYRLPAKQKATLALPWKELSSETTLNFSEKTKARDEWSVYLLNFSKFQGDSTLFGNILLREDLFLFRHRRDLSFRLRGEISQSLSNLNLSGGQDSKKRNLALRVRRSFNERWVLQVDVNRQSDVRSYRNSSASGRDILTWGGSAEPVWRPNRSWEIGLRLVGQQDRDGVQNIKALRYGTEPRLVRNFTEKGRAEMRFEWHKVTTASSTLPYEMAAGDPPGDNFRWDLRLDYKLSRYMTASVNYNGSKDADREAIHIGRAEVRAFF